MWRGWWEAGETREARLAVHGGRLIMLVQTWRIQELYPVEMAGFGHGGRRWRGWLGIAEVSSWAGDSTQPRE